MTTIYWFLLGPSELPSSRIHGRRVHHFLAERGWRSELVLDPLHVVGDVPAAPYEFEDLDTCFGPGDVAIIQKLQGPNTCALVQHLSKNRVTVVYVDCDYPPKLAEARLSDAVVCSSRFLAAEYSFRGLNNVFWIPDAWETHAPPRQSRYHSYRCLWFGMGTVDKWKQVQSLKALISARSELSRWTMYTISNHRDADVIWDLKTAWDTIADFDVVLIPAIESKELSSKSANRITQAMALGIPVAAFPLPEYRQVIRDGRNGFLCRQPEDWVRCLVSLEDHSVRRRIALSGYRYARRHYSIDRIGSLWLQFLSDISATSNFNCRKSGGSQYGMSVLRNRMDAKLAATCLSATLRKCYEARNYRR